MARLASASGTRQIVATPHVGQIILSPDRISEEVSQLNTALSYHNIDLEIFAGAEVEYHLDGHIWSRYCLHDSRYLLLEFPHTHLPTNANDVIFRLLSEDLQPVIAHPERNPAIIRQPKILSDLVAQGALAQITAGSLTGDFGPSIQSCARYLLKQGMVHFLASDGHSSTWRSPVLTSGLKIAAKLIGQGKAKKLVDDNPRKILAGEPWSA